MLDQILQLLELEYGGIHKDYMHKMKDFQKGNEDTTCTIYTKVGMDC
jgi:hypothetical protein